jgi:ParB-like chromosome segregation protein Spo0J
MAESPKTISRIWLDGINVGVNPLRPLIDAEVKRLAISMQQIGMMTPITVRYHDNIPSADSDDSFELITGRHRVAAAKLLGWEIIDAIEIVCSDVDAKLWEIAENLHRADLTTLQRDEQVAMWIELTEQKNNDVAQVAPHRKAGQQPGGIRAASRDLGIDRDDANRAVKVASLSDEAKDAAREHGLDDNRTALLEAARETEPAAQVAAIVERATRTPKLPDVGREPKLSEFKRVDGTIKAACDFNPEDPGDVAESGDTKEEIRHRIFVHHYSEAVRHARAIEELMREAAASEITTDITEGARAAASAWCRQAELQIDPSTLSMSAQKKLQLATEQAKRELQAGYQQAVTKGIQEALEQRVLPHYKMMEKKYRDLIESRTKGVMDKKTFRLIWSCLHTDSRKSVTDEKLNEAFQLFSKMETRLMSEKDDPTPKFKMPTTVAEWEALEVKAKAERKAKRGHQSVARR